MAKQSQREREQLTDKQIEEIEDLFNHYLKQLAEFKEQIRKAKAPIEVRSMKTLRLGLHNVNVGFMRIQEAIQEQRFGQISIMNPNEVAKQIADDMEKMTADRKKTNPPKKKTKPSKKPEK